MSRRLVFDEGICINCKACEVHCQVWNRTPPGIKLGAHLSEGPVMRGGKPSLSMEYAACRHCDDAFCIAACPTEAIRRRDDGIVYVETESCVGCKTCVGACPWGAIHYDKSIRKARKCELCRERLDEGLLPACVTGCVTRALAMAEE